MRVLLIIVLLGLCNYSYCSISCNLTYTLRDQCNCHYDYVQAYCGDNIQNSSLTCIKEEAYIESCNNGTCTGDITIKDNITCPYNTTEACTFPGVQGMFCAVVIDCLEMFGSNKQCCPIDSSFLLCPCFVRTACVETGCFIMNDTSFAEVRPGGEDFIAYCENCSTCIDRRVPCPTQPMNPNKQLVNCFGDIQCVHHHDVENVCLSGCTCRIINFVSSFECSNISFLFQLNCATNFSLVCQNGTDICIDNDNLFNLCENGTILLHSCNFTVPPPPPPVTPSFPIPPIPPFAPIAPFPIPPFTPFTPIDIPAIIPTFPIPPSFPVPSTPISPTPTPIIPTVLNGCGDLKPPQLNCDNGSVRLCCNVRCDQINIITGNPTQSICAINNTNNLILICQNCDCFEGNCPIITAPMITPVAQNEIALEIIIIIIIAGIVALCLFFAFFSNRLQNDNGFISLE